MTAKVEIQKFIDGRLKVLVRFTRCSNFWMSENGSCSYVPKKSEIQLIKETLDAIDAYNTKKLEAKRKRIPYFIKTQ